MAFIWPKQLTVFLTVFVVKANKMPSCAFSNCFNSSEKGFRVHAFPKDENQRRLWGERSGRDFSGFSNGLPTTNMRVCEVHFSEEQYLEDGRYGRKLKSDAVPMAFVAAMDVERAENALENQQVHRQENLDDHDLIDHESLNEEIYSPGDPLQCAIPSHALLEEQLEAAKREIQRLQNVVAALRADKHHLHRKVRISKDKNDNFKANLGHFLAEDQIRRLEVAGKGTGFRWTETVPRSSNYEDEDDNTYILEFLQTRRREQPNAELIEEDDFAEPQDLTHLQEQGLYKTAGWVAHKISSACEPCIQAITSEEPLEDCPFEWTTMLSRGGLTHPSLALYQTVKVAEVVFNSLKDTLLHCTAPITTLTEQIQEHIDPELYQVLRPDCGHDLVPDILRKFINLRVHILADDRTRRIPQAIAHAGRACYMATAANRR